MRNERVSPGTESMQGAVLGLLHAWRRKKPSLQPCTSPEVGPDLSSHWQLNVRLMWARPAPLPSLELFLTHLQSIRAPLPQGDLTCQTCLLDVWDNSRAHVSTLQDFFPSLRHRKRPPSANLSLTPRAQWLQPLAGSSTTWTPYKCQDCFPLFLPEL